MGRTRRPFRVINGISVKGAATIHIIYQIADITVNIYDILIYHEWQKSVLRKRKESKEKEYINSLYKFIINNNIYNILYLLID